MARETTKAEPVGFTEHTRKQASEHAHEQGWGLSEDERTQLPTDKPAFAGGKDYDYGARDFGDEAVDTSAVQPSPEAVHFLTPEATTKQNNQE